MHVYRYWNDRRNTVNDKETEMAVKYQDLTIEYGACGPKKDEGNTSNNRGNWNHLKIIQKTPEQYTGKARNYGTTESSYIGHCTYTAGSAIVQVQNI
jgi:hypothetical protein